MEAEVGSGTALILGLLAAYFFGSIPFGVLIAKLWGISDVRKKGSGNIGATNVVRSAGWLAGALTFLFDGLKGFLPSYLFSEWFTGKLDPVVYGVAGVLGHCFSMFLSFAGGKGVSTALGMALGLHQHGLWIGGICILVYAIGLVLTGVSALGSLFSMLTYLSLVLLWSTSGVVKVSVLFVVILVIIRHRANWEKLLNPILIICILLGASAQHSLAGEITDFRGTKKTFKDVPVRVVALLPSIAETIAEMGFVDHLVGIPEHTDIDNQKITKVGPYTHVSVEEVIRLKPDLVFSSIDGNDASQILGMEKMGINVVVLNTQSVTDILRSIDILGSIFEVPNHPKILALKKALAVKRNGKKERVFLQVGWDPIVTVSKKTFIDEILSKLGAENIFSNGVMKYPRPSAETVVKYNPDIILICQLTSTGKEEQVAQKFWERFGNLNAVKNKKIYIIPRNWLTKPSFILTKGIDRLRALL
ncbi:MAG: glycerol-3-phosphate acyltransferase [Bacteriovoracia bacterium]